MIKSGFVFRLILVMWISAPGQAVALDVEEYPALVELVDIMTEDVTVDTGDPKGERRRSRRREPTRIRVIVKCPL